MNAYIQEVLEKVEKRDKNEPEFLQTVEEVLKSLETVIDQHPEYQKAGLLERLVEPERVIEFILQAGFYLFPEGLQAKRL